MQLEGTVGTKPGPDGYRNGNPVLAPLRKRRLTGELYERDRNVEALIAELPALPRDELLGRAVITKRSQPGYVPSECLVHFIRASRHDNNQAWFERLYRILMERVLRSVPKSESSDGKTESLTRSAVRDKVFSRFVEMLSADRASYVDKLEETRGCSRANGALPLAPRRLEEKLEFLELNSWDLDDLFSLWYDKPQSNESIPRLYPGLGIHSARRGKASRNG
ncbi:hypothetical protein ACVJMZ_006795 [Sinorhizobium medicae]